jgi:glycosyltransferase involved in cell wall biosynthesis
MLTHDFPPQPGGIANHVYEISKRLVRQGHEVFVIKQKVSKKEQDCYAVDGIRVYSVSELPMIRIRNPYSFVKMTLKIREIIRDKRIDLIHTHGFFYECIMTKFAKKVPIVFTNHESGFLEMAARKRYRNLISYVLNHVDFLIGPSEELARIPWQFGVRPELTRFIPNGVDTKRFNSRINGKEIRKKYHFADDDIVIICARRLEPKNGVEFLIKAVPLIARCNPMVRLLIVGGGFPEERKRFEDFILRLGLKDKVTFSGSIDYSFMPQYYAAADMAILPSLMEATSLAGLEAMATGLPLIGTDVGGIPFIIEDKKTGIIIPPRDVDAIAKSIMMLAKNKSLRDKLGRNARKKVEKQFSWDIITDELVKIYYDVVTAKSAR